MASRSSHRMTDYFSRRRWQAARDSPRRDAAPVAQAYQWPDVPWMLVAVVPRSQAPLAVDGEGGAHLFSCTHRALIDSHPAPFSRGDVERIPKQIVRALPRQQHRDQPRCQFLEADAVHLIEDVDRPVALPRELDSHRLTLLRDPDSVDAPEGTHVALACHGNSERFLLVRQHNRFQDCSVCVGDRHASILRLPASANKSLQVQCFRPVGTGPVLTMVMEPATAVGSIACAPTST